jgi:hypothetical protein
MVAIWTRTGKKEANILIAVFMFCQQEIVTSLADIGLRTTF